MGNEPSFATVEAQRECGTSLFVSAQILVESQLRKDKLTSEPYSQRCATDILADTEGS